MHTLARLTRHNPASARLSYIHGSSRTQAVGEASADFAGPFKGKLFLIVIDAYSKRLEPLQLSNFQCHHRHLHNMFATHQPSYIRPW